MQQRRTRSLYKQIQLESPDRIGPIQETKHCDCGCRIQKRRSHTGVSARLLHAEKIAFGGWKLSIICAMHGCKEPKVKEESS